MKIPVIVSAVVVSSCLSVPAKADGKLNWEIGRHADLATEALGYLSAGRLPESETVVRLLDRRRITIDGDKVAERVELVYYYPSTDSVQDNGVDTVYWDTSGEHLTMLESAVISPTGDHHAFDPSTAERIDADSYKVFTDTTSVVMQLPHLQPGSLSVLSYQRELLEPDNYHFNVWVQDSLVTELKEVIVTWTDTAPAWHLAESDMQCSTSPRQLTCRAEQVPAADLDVDVLYADVLPQLNVSAPKSWDDIIGDMWELIEPAMEAGPNLQAAIEDVSAVDQPLHAAHALASKDIRYVSFSKGEHSHRPHAVERTLANRYGDCKDKSTLLLSLLRATGTQAYPVLVATERADASALVVPSRGYFDHMIVCAIVDGAERCFDPTDAYTPVTETSYGIQGRVRLNLVPGAAPTTVGSDLYLWRFKIKSNLQFQADGSQVEHAERVYEGALAGLYRDTLGGRNAKDLQEWLGDQYRETVSSDTEPKFAVDMLNNIDVPLKLESETTFDPFVDPATALDYTDTTFWLRKFMSDQRIGNEHYPVSFPGIQAEAVYRFDLNGLWRPWSTGAEVDFESEFGKFERTYQVDGQAIVVTTKIALPRRDVGVEEFERFNRYVSLIYDEMDMRFWGTLIN